MNFYVIAYWAFMTVLWASLIYDVFPEQINKIFKFACGRSTSDGIFNMISEGNASNELIKFEDDKFKSSRIFVEKNRTSRLAEEYGFTTVEYDFAQREYQPDENSESDKNFKNNNYVIKSACILTGSGLNAVLNTKNLRKFQWTCMWARTKWFGRKSWLVVTSVAVVFALYRSINEIF